MVVERPDAHLEPVVAEACATAEAPIGLLSIVLGYTRFVRAWWGVPATAPGAAVELCDALGQLVAGDDRPWIVEDIQEAAVELPGRLTGEMGVRAWLGHPIYVGDRVAGALCVLDTQPRRWPQSAWEHLAELATRASERARALDRGPGPEEREARVHDDLVALVRLMRGLSTGPVTLDDARVAVSVLGHPIERLYALQHDPTLRQRIEQTVGVDLGPLVLALQRG